MLNVRFPASCTRKRTVSKRPSTCQLAPSAKLALDFPCNSRLRVSMNLSEEERTRLPRDLFALAGRRLECGGDRAGEGQGSKVTRERMADLSGELHGVGQDLMVIADALAALAAELQAQ